MKSDDDGGEGGLREERVSFDCSWLRTVAIGMNLRSIGGVALRGN